MELNRKSDWLYIYPLLTYSQLGVDHNTSFGAFLYNLFVMGAMPTFTVYFDFQKHHKVWEEKMQAIWMQAMESTLEDSQRQPQMTNTGPVN